MIESTKPAGWWPVNINDYARVKLSQQALDLWVSDAAHKRVLDPTNRDLWPLEPPLDHDGYWRAQLWQIMRLIGPLCAVGRSAIEGCELQLEVRNQ